MAEHLDLAGVMAAHHQREDNAWCEQCWLELHPEDWPCLVYLQAQEIQRLRTELAAWKPGLRCPHCAERVSYRSEHRQGDRWTCEETDHG